MRRIFDALQRSGTEQSGVEYPDMMSVASAVFEAAPKPEAIDESVPMAVADLLAEMQPVPAQLATSQKSRQEQAPSPPFPTFPSLEVCDTPASRLVFFTNQRAWLQRSS